MRKIILVLGLLLSGLSFGQSNLIITAIYDAGRTGGRPKGVELYVIADITDLSEYGLGGANNGGGSDGQEFTFPGVSVTEGDYIYVSSEATEFTAFYGFTPDYITGAMNINGDDSIELFLNGTVVDIFGDVNTDGNGEPWEYLDGWAYRKNASNPSVTFNVNDWTFSGINALDDFATNALATTPVPVGTFTNSTLSTNDFGLQLNETILFPNPAPKAQGFVTVQNKVAGNVEVAIYNTIGMLVSTQVLGVDKTISIANLTAGIYFVQLISSVNMTTKKLIVQ